MSGEMICQGWYTEHAFTVRWRTEDGRLRCYYCGAIEIKAQKQ